jgi:protein KIBRA
VGGVKVKHNETSLDLELDLAAQHSRFQVLKDEISRLKKIKDELERLKDKGERELPAWIGEDTLFIRLIQNMETNEVEKSAEEKKMEKLLRRTAKEIYKLRRTKKKTGQLAAQSFRD